MEIKQIINHTMRKSGLPLDTEYNIYGLVLKHWNLDTNLQVDIDVDYNQLLSDVPTIVASVVIENIKELNNIFLELTRLYRKIRVIVRTTGYYFKVAITCYK